MKKLFRIFLAVTLIAAMMAFTACGDEGGSEQGGNEQGGETAKLDITGVSFEGAEYTFDGSEKVLSVSGALPEGVSVSYTNERATDAGEYSATATLSGEGYNTLTLSAILKINKAQLTSVSAEASQQVKETGEPLVPELQGEIPEGVEVSYYLDGVEYPDGFSDAGTYSVVILLKGKNYQTLELPVEFKISLDLKVLATKMMDAFGAVPDVWEFLPESFNSESFLVDDEVDYTDFVNVSDIPVNGIGKQMNVVYSLLNKTEVALSYVNKVYAAMNTVKALYTEYLDKSPEDYKHFSGTAAGFSFTLEMTEEQYLMSAGFGSVLVTVYADTEEESYGAHIRLSETNLLKYTVSGETLTVALDVLDSVSTLINFYRGEDGNAVGVFYEYIVLGDKQVTATSAMLRVGEEYTTVIGTKGDFIPTSVSRNCEIYENETGMLVGTEVREELDTGIGIALFNTYWFPLNTVHGITSIKKEDTANGTNADTIWINGYADDTIHTTLYGVNLSQPTKAPSRTYDIEFKTMYFYKLNEETGEYETVSMEIPMIFIQEETLEDFEKNFAKKNKDALDGGSVDLVVKTSDFAAITFAYQVVLPVYDQIKDAVTHQDIIDYCKSGIISAAE